MISVHRDGEDLPVYLKKSLPIRGGRTYMDKDVPVSVWPEWKLVEKIGEGSFGKVYKAKRTERGRSFYSAIKIISIPGSKGNWIVYGQR